MAFEKHLLVDGANIIHAWPELRTLLPRERDTARGRLAQRLAAIHDNEQVRVTLVHDGRGPELVVERPADQLLTFSILYTPSSHTADDVIERLVAKAGIAADCTVASGDRGIRQTIEALGATWIAPDELAAWVERAEKRQSQQVARLRRTTDAKWRRKE